MENTELDKRLENSNTLSKSLSDTKEKLALELRDTMRNLGTTAGAVAVGALILLGSGRNIVNPLILVGVVSMLSEATFVFVYLLHTHTSAINEIDDAYYGFLEPLRKSFEAVKSGKASNIQIDDTTPAMKRLGKTLEKRKRKEGREFLNISLVLAASVLGFGTLMIIFGVASVSVCDTWNILCL